MYLAGKLNIIADQESRALENPGDWKLSPTLFRKINFIWPAEVDLFATTWNNQLPRFVSWRPQPGAWTTNAFSLNWSSLEGYAFPPFALIHRC